jgi:hypothetical protein
MHRLSITERDHSHYGAETQLALQVFREMWTSYSNTTWIKMKENAYRLDSIQAAWDALAKARRLETGTGFYLTKEEHENVNAR